MRKEPMNVRLWSSKSSFRLWKAVGKGVDGRSYSSYIARLLLPGHSLFASSCLPWNFSRWGSSTKEEEAAAKGRQAQNLWAHFRAQNPSTRAQCFQAPRCPVLRVGPVNGFLGYLSQISRVSSIESLFWKNRSIF